MPTLLAGAVIMVSGVFGQKPSDKDTAATDAAAQAEAVKRLIAKLGAEDSEERDKAVKQLIATGPAALQRLDGATRSSDLEVARLAKQCIRKINNNVKIKAFLKQLQTMKEGERDEAVNGLIELRDDLADVIPTLGGLLDDPNILVKQSVVAVVSSLGPRAEVLVPKLVAILKETNPAANRLRMRVIMALEAIGPAARDALPILMQIVENDEPVMQRYAASALAKLGQDDARVGPTLLKVLTSGKDWDVQYAAAFSLALLRKEAEKAVPAMVQLLKAKSFKTLDELGQERNLVTCLGLYGPQAAAAIPYLVQVVKDGERNVILREEALRALMRIGPAAYAVVPGLKDLSEPISTGDLNHITRGLNKN
jgi:HEAT repeat protein